MKYDAVAFRKKLSGTYKKLSPSKIAAWIEANFDFKTRKSGAEYCINNPLDYDTGNNFNINPENGVCHDWRSNEWAGPINPKTNKRNCSFIKFVRIYRKCSYKDALREVLGASEDLSSYMRPESRITDLNVKKTVSVALPRGAVLLAISKDRQAISLCRWLNARGYTSDDIEKYELYHLGMDVYWPYYEFDILVYWQSRSRLNKRFNFPETEIKDESGKTVAITEGSKGDFLYGFDDVDAANYIIVTEAIFDKHTLRDQTLASGGAILTPRQIGKIKILGPKNGVILSPDNDAAGIKSILTNVVLLNGLSVYFSIPPKHEYEKGGEKRIIKDWNELYTGCKLSIDEIRGIHDGRIKKASPKELVKLRNSLRPRRY